MQAKTERRLGFVAASLLTAAAFMMPAATTNLVWNDPVESSHIKIASATIDYNALVQVELDRIQQSGAIRID